MFTNNKPSKSRIYIIVYGISGKKANAAIKFKLPKGLRNDIETAAAYFKKYLNVGETVLACAAYETLDFMEEIKALPIWNEVEVEVNKENTVSGSAQSEYYQAEHAEMMNRLNEAENPGGVEKFASIGDLVKGKKEDVS